MFKLADGRDCLYQWDSNLKLIVEDESISEVHFTARYSKEIYTLDVIRTESEAYVNIPNILLQQTYSVIVYAVSNSGSGNYTKIESAFEVKARPKPSNYLYEETEVKTWLSLEKKLDNELAIFRNQLSAIPKFTIKPVYELPTEDISETTIYLLRSEEKTENLYKEYIYVNGKPELLGSASVEVDLSEYVKNTDYASQEIAGVIRTLQSFGIDLFLSGNWKGFAKINKASNTEIDNKSDNYKPIVSSNLDYAVMKALSDSKLEWTDEQKQLARALLGAIGGEDYAQIAEYTEQGFVHHPGIVAINNGGSGRGGITIDKSNKALELVPQSETHIDKRYNGPSGVICAKNLDYAIKSGLTKCQLDWTDEEKAKALELLGGVASSNVKMEAFALSIPLRDGSGRILTQTPTADAHATTKKYVDDLVGDIETSLDAIIAIQESLIGGEVA